MTWTCMYEGKRFVLTDQGMIDHLARRYTYDRSIGDEFSEWVNETYTPWEALCENFDETLETWAREIVTHRQDIVERLLPWVHWEAEE